MINVHIKDPDVLGAQAPPELATYLRARGLTLARRTDTSAFWTLPADDDEYEVQQPLDQGLRDYALRNREGWLTFCALCGSGRARRAATR